VWSRLSSPYAYERGLTQRLGGCCYREVKRKRKRRRRRRRRRRMNNGDP
jgi:hypothetical protein